MSAPVSNVAQGAQRRKHRFNSRQKEEAEIQRLTKLSREIPRYKDRFMLFRKNRRQKAKQSHSQHDPQSQEPSAFVATAFSQLPISKRSLDGLAGAGFQTLTPIQRVAIPQALAGRDVLAAAPTGSGKTLAFLVPLLEALWQDSWSTQDGLAAIVITPTRELAMQIFDVLRKIGAFHVISAGLVIGGKDFEAEKLKVGNMNVLVATPGRLLHHMDIVAELDCTSVKMLILDEADRILDMGFSKSLDAIIENLPKQRQTLLFSATQTKDVRALARLSLQNPEYVAVSGNSPDGTASSAHDVDRGSKSKDDTNNLISESKETDFVGVPETLTQTYVVLPAHGKLSMLWSFIKSHLKTKMIIFFSSTKQVRFAFEAFCKLRPGMSLLHLHGGMKQQRRADMYELFCRTKSAALLCTDVASRGLDFPEVEWVVQADCPEDVETYVHRVGRTARLNKTGRALLLLSEGKQEKFVQLLHAQKITPRRTEVNANRLSSLDSRMTALVASNVELRHLAQKALVVYVNSVHRRSNKDIFDITELDFAALAKSFGLSVAPKVSFVKEASSGGAPRSDRKSVYGYKQHLTKAGTAGESGATANIGKKRPNEQSDASDSEDEVLRIKSVGGQGVDADVDGLSQKEASQKSSARKRRKKERKLDLFKNMPSANRVTYDDDGNRVEPESFAEQEAASKEFEDIAGYAADVSRRLGESNDLDKLHEHGRVRALRLKRKRKEKEGTAEKEKEENMETDEEEGSAGSEGDDGDDSEQGGTLDGQSALALSILRARQ